MQTEIGVASACSGGGGQFLRENSEYSRVDFALDPKRFYHREAQQPKPGRPAVLHLACGSGLAFLPAKIRSGDRRERLPGKIDTGHRGQRDDMVFCMVEIGAGTRLPVTRGIFGDDEPDGGALEILPVALDKDAAGFGEARDRNAPGLIQFQRGEQARDERRAEVRLVFDEGIGERQLGCCRLGNPGLELGTGPEGVIDALVKIVADQVIGGTTVEEHHGIVVTHQPRR